VKRREFITLLGCAVAVEPYAAGAQQVSKTAKVGLLYPGMAAALPSRVAGLRDGLQTAGYREPDNVEFLNARSRWRSNAYCSAGGGVGRAQG
jgi:hypothetical protein